MATDIERMVLELSANYRKLQKDLERANSVATSNTRRLQRNFAMSNEAIARSSDQMATAVAKSYARAASSAMRNGNALKNALLGSASAIAAGFSVAEVGNLADGYTRFTNQLKVAGLEGDRLAGTQDKLFATAQKYGVELEGLGALYGKLSQSGKELGATSADLLKFTNGVAAGLKVQGGTADSTRGALTQLTQALGGTIVRAEEYNSINEGARPILQAVANGSDRFKGSLSGLRNAVIAGTVTSKEFFAAFLKGSAALEGQATKANLTIAASFTILNNALGRYIGQTDQSLSATQRLSGGLITLANNLDTIIPALGVIVAFIGARYAASALTFVAAETGRQAALVRTTLATQAAANVMVEYVAVGNASIVTANRMSAAIAGEAVAMGVAANGARALGGALLGAFGGPVGLALIALTAGIVGLTAAEHKAREAGAEYGKNTAALSSALGAYEDAALAAATATGAGATAARDAAKAAREQAVQERDAAKALLQKAQASLAAAEAEGARVGSGLNVSTVGGFNAGVVAAGQQQASNQAARARAEIGVAQANLNKAIKSIAATDSILNSSGNGPAGNAPLIKSRLADIAALEKQKAMASGAALDEIKAEIATRQREIKYLKQGVSETVAKAAATREVSATKKATTAATKSARQAEAARLDTIRDDKAYDVALRQAQIRLADAKTESASVEEERLKLQLDSLEAERVLRNKEIAAEGPGGTKRYDAKEVARLQDLNDQATAQEKNTLEVQKAARIQRDAVMAAADSIATQLELLGYQHDMTDTAAERRAVEKRILALQQQEERDRLNAIIKSKDPSVSPGDKTRAQQRLDALPQIEKAQTDAFIKDQRDALKSNILYAFDAAKGGAAGLAEFFGDKLKEKLLDSLAGNLADLIMGQGGKGGLLGTAGKLFGIPGFAAGTSFAPGGLAMVHKNEMINLPKGSRVNTAAQTQAMLRGSMSGPGRGGGTTIVADFSGAVVTQDLIDSFSSMVQGAEARATVNGAQLGQARMSKKMGQSRRGRLGR